MDFYQGNVLRVDLTSGSAAVEPLNMDWAERYIGGKGLLLRYMWDYVPPKVDPWSPDNPVFLVTGPFAGTNVSTCSRLVVGAKSPATGILNDSYVGGSFAPEMKFAGYDLIIITGKAAEPVVLWIKDGSVEFVPAREKYWGLKTSEVEAALRADLDKDAKVLSIGPAGENLIPWACLSTDQFHKAGRAGHGALFGSKNLKAVAIRGTGSVMAGDARAFLADMQRIHAEHVLTDFNLWANEEGTPILVDPVNGAGALPTRNWSQGTFDGVAGINSEAMLKVKVGNRACYQCALGCRQVHEAGGVKTEGPEFETIALCGANCGVGDIEALMRFNHECDEWGLDTISSGSVVGLAMDLTEKGIADFGLRFGVAEGYLAAPALIAERKGTGAELALGARVLAAAYGVPEMGMEVKNLELPGYDPRGAFGMSVAYATSDRGGCHMRAYPIADEVLEGTRPADSLEGKAEQVIKGNVANGFIGQNFSSIKFSGIWCDFWAVDPGQLCQMFRHVWKREFTEDEVMLIGERIWNLGRLFNLREGVEPDTMPRKLYAAADAFRGGPSGARPSAKRPSGPSYRSTTVCGAGTRTACRRRPNWPQWAWTSASRAGCRVEKGTPMPHVMIASKKCTGCHMCELACSAWHEGVYRPSVARLSVAVNATTAEVKGQTCLQTACAKCEEACQEGAIERLPIEVTATGLEAASGYVLKVNEDLCTNCGTCYDACPYGVIREHPDRAVAFKCDLCDGMPQCVAFCQNPHVLAVSVRQSKLEKNRDSRLSVARRI